MPKKIIDDGSPKGVFTGEGLTLIHRPEGIPAPGHVVAYNYLMWLCQRVGLNGPNPFQTYRTPETDDKTYFMLAQKLWNTEFKLMVPLDKNRISDGRKLRHTYALLASAYSDYSILDKPGCSLLEVLVALVNRFDTDIMMTSEKKDRSKEWFWLMMRNASLDIFVDAGFTEPDNYANEQCDSIIFIINNRQYAEDGKGGFFPLKRPNANQKTTEMWYQMQQYFLENMIE
jgi:hypothetical protein